MKEVMSEDNRRRRLGVWFFLNQGANYIDVSVCEKFIEPNIYGLGISSLNS